MIETPNIPYVDEPEEWKQFSDVELAEAWYQEEALCVYSVSLDPPLNEGNLFQEYLKQAEKGNICAQYALGKMYLQGILTSENAFYAALWLSRASAAGSPFADYELAKMFQFGVGIAADQKSAVELYRKAYTAFFKIQIDNPNQTVELKMSLMRKNIFNNAEPEVFPTLYRKRNHPFIAHSVRPIQLKRKPVAPLPRHKQRYMQIKRQSALLRTDSEQDVSLPDVPAIDKQDDKIVHKPDKATSKLDVPISAFSGEISAIDLETKDEDIPALEEKKEIKIQPITLPMVSDETATTPCKMRNMPELDEKEDMELSAISKPDILVHTEPTSSAPDEKVVYHSDVQDTSVLEEKQSTELEPISQPDSLKLTAQVSALLVEKSTISPNTQDMSISEEKINTEPEPDLKKDADMESDTELTFGYHDPQTFKDAVNMLEVLPIEPGKTCAILDGGEIVCGEIDRLEIYRNALIISVMIDDLRRPFPISMVGKAIFVGPEFYQKAQKAALKYL